jgi:hypothetical protein
MRNRCFRMGCDSWKCGVISHRTALLAVKIHAFLCDYPTHEKLMERVDYLLHLD